jgi:hypothetical protein
MEFRAIKGFSIISKNCGAAFPIPGAATRRSDSVWSEAMRDFPEDKQAQLRLFREVRPEPAELQERVDSFSDSEILRSQRHLLSSPYHSR